MDPAGRGTSARISPRSRESVWRWTGSDARSRSELPIAAPHCLGVRLQRVRNHRSPVRSAVPSVASTWAAFTRQCGTRSAGLATCGGSLACASSRTHLPRRSLIRRATGVDAGRRAAGLIAALLLLSYPLHPPKRADQPRTAHFQSLSTPALFVHGTRDGFGSVEELRAALELIPARTELLTVERAGHELVCVRTKDDVARSIVNAFWRFVAQ